MATTEPTITVTGASDDLIEVDGAIREEFNARDTDRGGDGNLLAFSDGTVLHIDYTRAGVWRIAPLARGTATLTIDQCSGDEDDDRYTDVATLAGDVRWVVHGNRIERAG